MNRGKKYKVFNILVYLFVLLLFSACSKLIEVPPPIGQIDREVVFSNDATANSAMAGLYIQMTQTNLQFSSIGMSLFPGLSADELINSSSIANYDEFTSNSISPTNSIIRTNFWSFIYNIIFQANNIIIGLENSNSVTPSLKTQLIAEAKFIRGFCHFYLVNLFGDVPLITVVDYQTSGKIDRIPSSLVYEQIIKDLIDAENNLSPDYSTSGRVRPNKWSAASLLARVYLYQKDWVNAEIKATDVINSGMYSLVTNLSNVFLAESNEAIWQLYPATTSSNTWEGNVFIPSSNVIPSYVIANKLLDAFSNDDKRKSVWLKSVTIGGNTYYYPYKYKVRTGATLTEYYMVLRFAELYLIRAEARANRDDLTGSIADLNSVRTRAELSNLPNSLNKEQLLLAVEQERRVELFVEWGHRWLDLKRTNRADVVFSNSKPGWQATDTLYPIPFLEIQANPLLTQNKGY